MTDVKSTIKNAPSIRPEYLILSDVKWKYLVRSVLRGENVMMLGAAGCGKTLAASTVANAMQRPFHYFNLGATQDPRGSLIGNMHFDKDTGTYFSKSAFVHAIQQENSVILLDELSRAHPEAWNILMTVLDHPRRILLRLQKVYVLLQLQTLVLSTHPLVLLTVQSQTVSIYWKWTH